MKNPTIQQLLQTIDAYNKAHELHLKYPAEIRLKPNPLLESLYDAAAMAAQQLQGVLKAQIKKQD